MAANLKFDGSLVLQLQGDGAVALLVAECRADLSVRATVKLRDRAVRDDDTLQTLVNPNGSGRFVVVLDPPKDTPGRWTYQGVVPIEGDSVAEALEQYMLRSEQLHTRIGSQPTISIALASCYSNSPRKAGYSPRRCPMRRNRGFVPIIWPTPLNPVSCSALSPQP